MSYSVCIKCEEAVLQYEKYCKACVEKYGVAQDIDWHKNNSFANWDVDRKKEFQKDVTNISVTFVPANNLPDFHCVVCGVKNAPGKVWCAEHRPESIGYAK